MLKKILAGVSVLGALSLGITPVFAQGTTTTINVNPQTAGFHIGDLGTLINSLLTVALSIVGLLVFVFLVWGGVEWVTAGGDKSKTESARQKITNAIIGLAIVAAAFALGKVLGAFFGVNIGTSLNIPTAANQ